MTVQICPDCDIAGCRHIREQQWNKNRGYVVRQQDLDALFRCIDEFSAYAVTYFPHTKLTPPPTCGKLTTTL